MEISSGGPIHSEPAYPVRSEGETDSKDPDHISIYSQAAAQRAKETVEKAQAKELDKVQKQLFHLQAQRFESEVTARTALVHHSVS